MIAQRNCGRSDGRDSGVRFLYELTARLIMRHKVAISRQALAKHIDVLEEAAGLVSSEEGGKYRMLVFDDEPLRTVVNRWLK